MKDNIPSDAKVKRLDHAVRAALAARNALKAAERSYDSAFRTAYPSGALVHWMHGEFIQIGEVVYHGHGRIKVKNHHTKREVWLDRERILL